MHSSDFRAKQFLPFDSLKGFYDVIRETEKISSNKVSLIDDGIFSLDDKFHKLKKGMNVVVKYYYGMEYVETSGVIKKIDNIFKVIYLLDSKINFDDILDIEIL